MDEFVNSRYTFQLVFIKVEVPRQSRTEHCAKYKLPTNTCLNLGDDNDQPHDDRTFPSKFICF